MWKECVQLTVKSRHIRPIQNRLTKVVKGRTVDVAVGASPVVMVKALISLTGSDFHINKGEEMILLNNTDEHLWRVQTSVGEREVASVIFGLVGPHEESVFQAEG